VANAAHLKLITRGARRWNQWRKRHLSEGIDLSGADLHGLDLSGINFNGVNLTDANLNNASLKGALLRFANLISSDCRGADLSEADFNSACLRHANLSRAQLSKTDLCRADLREADLSYAWGEQSFWIEANLAGANLESAHFNQSILTEANLQNASLIKTNLSKADLSFINLKMANLSGANLSKVICIEGNISEANLSGANLFCANCQRTTFQGSSLQETNLIGGNFGECDFTTADLSFAMLKDAKIINTKFESANLTDICWGKESQNVIPYEVTLEGIQWSLPAAEFSQDLQQAIVESTVLEAAILSETEERSPHDALVRDRSVVENIYRLEGRSPLTLSFPHPIHWVAIALALHQMSQISNTKPIVHGIETPTPEETILSLSISAQALSTSEFEDNLRQRYEALRQTFAQTLPTPVGNTESESLSEDSILKEGALNQLLTLVISNLI
jgi:uncharacterized protein YjbI with pentapeptide repeats